MMVLSVQHPMLKMRGEVSLFLEQLELDIAHLNQNSNQSFQKFKEHLSSSLREWQGVVFRTKQQLSCLPRELRKSDVVQRLKKSLRTYERSVKVVYEELRSTSLNHYDDLTIYLKKLKENIDVITEEMDTVPQQSIFTRILKQQKILPARNRLQWGRKYFHTASGLVGLWLYAYSGLTEWTVIGILASYLTVAVGTEILRRIYPKANVILCRRLNWMMRERERTSISSATWYLGSMLVIFLVFSREVSILSLFYVAVGDTIAGIVGSQWGRHKLAENVSLEGSLAAFTACFLGTYFLTAYGLKPFYLTGTSLLLFSFLGGFIGALSEAVFKKWDDNLIIPLVSAPLLWVIMKIFI